MNFSSYVQRGLGKLVGIFWGKPRLATVMKAILEEIQELEDIFTDIEDALNIDTADAVRLERIGRIVGQGSLGLPLESHRALVRGRVKTNRSSGNTDNFIDVATLLGIADILHVVDQGNASLVVYVEEPITTEQAFSLHFLVPDLRRAGISAEVLTTNAVYTEPGVLDPAGISFASTVDPVTTPGTTFYKASRS